MLICTKYYYNSLNIWKKTRTGIWTQTGTRESLPKKITDSDSSQAEFEESRSLLMYILKSKTSKNTFFTLFSDIRPPFSSR